MPEELIRRNRLWAEHIHAETPDYFSTLAKLQRPDYLWIGCSDARVPANVITGLEPGEVFVHRNVANVVHSSDLNLLSALEFGIFALGVRKIIVCGHYNCGGVHAAADDHAEHGLADHWIEPIRRLRQRYADELNRIDDTDRRLDRLTELNVIDGAARIADTPILRKAARRDLNVEIHGMVYSLADGLLHRLPESAAMPHAS